MSLLHLPDFLVHAFGWTLLHSFWQGGLIALMVALLTGKHEEARTRYLAAAAGLLAILVSALLTFWYLMTHPAGQAGTLPHSAAQVMALPVAGFFRFTDEFLLLMVRAWTLGVALLVSRFAGGLVVTHRLTHRGLTFFGSSWQSRIATLAGRLGIDKAVVFAESALAHAPMTIGFFKPVILFPLGLFCQLSTRQLEAVLLHELGHIARRDYLFNMLQTTAEIVFFFNPAAWWMSARMRVEREHCCDDLAVAVTRDPICFAKMLVQLREIAPVNSGLAMAASGNGDLMFRIRRLIEGHGAETKPDRSGAVLFALTGLFALAALAPTGRASKNGETERISAEAQILTRTPSLTALAQKTAGEAKLDRDRLTLVTEQERLLQKKKVLGELRKEKRIEMLVSAESEIRETLEKQKELARKFQELALLQEELAQKEPTLKIAQQKLAKLHKDLQALKAEIGKRESREPLMAENRLEQLTRERQQLLKYRLEINRKKLAVAEKKVSRD